MSLQSPIANEFSLFLMEKSPICKIKSQCLFDEKICTPPSFSPVLCIWKGEREAGPVDKGTGTEQAACFPLVSGMCEPFSQRT